MGKLVLVSGPGGSGKSSFAEALIAQTKGARYYIATMHSTTEENRLRIEKHRRQRAGLDFQTLERCYRVSDDALDDGCVVLLEDVSNLLANVIFERGGNEDEVLADICRLRGKCCLLVVVTISGLRDEEYDEETADFIHALNKLNDKLFDLADVTVTMQDHVPVCQKGDWHDFI